MRLDKYLKVSRLIKRRTVANEVADAGRILINGKIAKASQAVKEGDIIEVTFGNRPLIGEPGLCCCIFASPIRRGGSPKG